MRRQRTTLAARGRADAAQSLDEALRLGAPSIRTSWPIDGGTDVMVELNFDRARPPALLESERGARAQGLVARERHAAPGRRRSTYTECRRELGELLPALAEASRTVGSPQIQNRGTLGGNLGTSSPAGDSLPPLLVEGAEVELASVRGERRVPLAEFLVGPKQERAAREDELIVAVRVAPSAARGRRS